MLEQLGIVAQAFAWLNMDPRGLVTSMMGAVLSLFFWNGNGFSWSRTAGIALASMFTGGYTLTVIIEYVDTLAVAQLLNILAGFMASDLFSSIKSRAPTITNVVGDFLLRKARAVFGLDPSESPPPPQPPTPPPT